MNMLDDDRQKYGLGSIVKGLTKGSKGAKGAKDIDDIIGSMSKKELKNLSPLEKEQLLDMQIEKYGVDNISKNKQINKELMGYKIPIKRKVLIVDSVQIIGHYNQKLFVKVCFSGTIHGVFFLSGTPEITPGQFLVVSDLAYDVKTKSVLLKTARWIFDKRILGLLSTSAKFDLKPFLTEATSSINQHVNTTLDEGVYLSGSIDKLLLSGLKLGTTGLFLNTEVSGNLKLKIK